MSDKQPGKTARTIGPADGQLGFFPVAGDSKRKKKRVLSGSRSDQRSYFFCLGTIGPAAGHSGYFSWWVDSKCCKTL